MFETQIVRKQNKFRRVVSTLEHMQVQKWDTCPEEKVSSFGMPHLLQMFYGNLA